MLRDYQSCTKLFVFGYIYVVRMHTIPELNAGVPAFLAKLWKLVEDTETDDLICWSPSGKSFFIRNQAQFARQLLPHYYKHNNMASFVRQLNMYGFHKMVSVELGGLKCDKDEMEFAHQFFCKNQPYLLEYIKRKIASSKTQDPAHAPIKSELMSKMLAEVRNMRGRQESLDNKLGAMKHENEALWRELAMLRQKHIKQQTIVNKLIHFLVTLVQPSSSLSVKRRYPLMIDNSSRSHKQRKVQSKTQASPTGPVIHELDASESDIDSEYIVTKMLENETPSVHNLQEHEIDDDNIETILTDDSLKFHDDSEMDSSHEIDTRKKHVCKDKKKRKNKLPIKILIPRLENEDELRGELLEMPTKKASATVVLPNNLLTSKSIPITAKHSSKLIAMAANIKSPDDEHDILTSSELEDDIELYNASILVNLKNVPEDNSDVQNDNIKSEKDTINKNIDQIYSDKNILMTRDDEQCSENRILKSKHEKKDTSEPSSSKDLSLTCVNLSGTSDTNYRSELTEEMDTHLESVQSDLDSLRDILRGEGYSIDANTLLGLFGAEDPMTFDLPINPELNPNCERENNDHIIADSENRLSGELMAYNPTSNLLEFDDDIFLSNAATDLSTNSIYNMNPSDVISLEDNKSSIFDSLVTNNMNRKS